MRRRMVTAAAYFVALFVASRVGFAQTPAGPSGHWEGTIDTPNQALAIQVDLAKSGDAWRGTITIPSQKLMGFPLSDIVVANGTVGFAIKGPPGTPEFKGTVAKDGTTISGTFSQGGGTTPFKLTRTGEAKFEAVPKSTPITKELEGSWAGTLTVEGNSLRLVLKLANQPGGAATGTMVSLDQNNAEIPLTVVTQKGTHVTVLLRPINGTFEGDLKDGQLIGTWTQGAEPRPLVFKRQP